jgi:hypothetical protein
VARGGTRLEQHAERARSHEEQQAGPHVEGCDPSQRQAGASREPEVHRRADRDGQRDEDGERGSSEQVRLHDSTGVQRVSLLFLHAAMHRVNGIDTIHQDAHPFSGEPC